MLDHSQIHQRFVWSRDASIAFIQSLKPILLSKHLFYFQAHKHHLEARQLIFNTSKINANDFEAQFTKFLSTYCRPISCLTVLPLPAIFKQTLDFYFLSFLNNKNIKNMKATIFRVPSQGFSKLNVLKSKYLNILIPIMTDKSINGILNFLFFIVS